MTHPEVVSRLRKLAAVEHALVVEYLYASYSVDAPRERPKDTDDDRLKWLWTINATLRRIAIDEMRHLLWANTALRLLGEKVSSIDRAQVIDGSVEGKRPVHTVEARPLTAETLQWFIDIERPSRSPTGMYLEVLTSIRTGPDFSDEIRRQVEPVIRLIIEEGEDHYHDLLTLQAMLPKLKGDPGLRTLDADPVGREQKADWAECDRYYKGILEEIANSFGRGEKARQSELERTQKTMENLDRLARRLAADNIGYRFGLPAALGLASAPRAD